MNTDLLKTSTVVAAKEQVSCDLAGEAVILNLKSGIYYGLDPVGAQIWSLIQRPTTVGAIINRLLEEYEVAPDRCESDLLNVLREMAEKELIEVTENSDGAHQ
jgi:hypothetical protein